MRASWLVVVMALLTGVLAVSQVGGGAQTPMCLGRVATHVMEPGVPYVGTSGPDVIVGTAGDDVIRGRGGNDRICAKGGDDRVWGNGGNDRINLGAGDDWAKGGKGDDRIWGKKGRDIVFGNGGKDTLNGGSGFDMLIGGKKADRILGKSGADSLEGNNGPDQLAGGKGIDACDGGPGTNAISSCNENVPFGPNPFVGWWQGNDLADGSLVTITIDPAGNLTAEDSRTSACDGDPARVSATGAQVSSTVWMPASDYIVLCVPPGEPEPDYAIVVVIPGNWTHNPATDTIEGPALWGCYSRLGAAACAR